MRPAPTTYDRYSHLDSCFAQEWNDDMILFVLTRSPVEKIIINEQVLTAVQTIHSFIHPFIMIVNMRYLKVPLLALGCALPRTVADPAPLELLPPKRLLVELLPPDSPFFYKFTSMCHNNICLSAPSAEGPTLVTGRHSTFVLFDNCEESDFFVGTVYQIEGTGGMLEVSLPLNSLRWMSIAVYETCSSGADGDIDDEEMSPDCVPDSYRGTRWMAHKGRLYSIVVRWLLLGSFSNRFILRVNAVKPSPHGDKDDDENTNSPMDHGTMNATSAW
ncbi:hypothetical protein FisN_26Lu073 [Fistulifera solaris]|uniref:Uncharacterized protein n=1 Tax=Fistulifera solaris TaxID=1519565 RepID=A0A1Z5KCZ2_FISSO|nr:hypothetical protein FisN_26Lu073 [Fistulifera solaris]|eukprot:GAX23992.1 hypothetical protein FisN_26Lu073 [Fistulifera solaris]